MKRLLWLIIATGLALGLVLNACSPQPFAPTGDAASGEGDSVGEAYRLLLQRSAEPVDPASLATAGVKGLRLELMTSGVIPPQVTQPAFSQDPSQDLVLLHQISDSALEQHGGKLSERRAEAAMIAEMAESVGDCHTAYLTAKDLQEQLAWMQDQTKFGGIGAQLRRTKPTEPLIIWRVFAGSPAEKAGLRSGDIIRGVNGQGLGDVDVQTAVNRIRGPVGTPVQLEIQSPGAAAPHSVVVVRGQIQPPQVEYRMLANRVGYVQIYGFTEGVPAAVRSALDALDRQGATSWVIDLRDNGGGLLDAVTQTVSMFAPKDALLFYLIDSSGKRTDYHADGSRRAQIPPITVLTNDGTGSGAEIMAAALSEFGLAQIVGEQTSGCVGTGQIFPLPNGDGLQVTIAQLMTSQGQALNRVGITPDVQVSMGLQDLLAGQDPQLTAALQSLRASASPS